MKIEFDIVYWKDDVFGKVDVIHKKMEEYAYRIAGIGEWKAVISDENVKLEAFKPVVVKIKRIEFPPNSIAIKLERMRHAYGSVIDVFHVGKPKYVENVRYVDYAVFLPICDGEIKKGELLGVINIIYVKPIAKSKWKTLFKELEEFFAGKDFEKLTESKD